MQKLNYDILKHQGYNGYLLEHAPERVLQFGEGNFMRAFVDYFFDLLNEKCDFNGKIVLCQPIASGLTEMINEQEGLYTLYLRGFENGEKVNSKRVISAVSRCINPYADFTALLDCAKNPDLRYLTSNTTEAGIIFDPTCRFGDAPPSSFPAKFTRFLYERFKLFGTQKGKGFVILSCELIDHNGHELQKCVEQYIKLWKLEENFATWVAAENIFCSTLVDRIVTGYPRTETDTLNSENGYIDNLLNTGEIFGFWVIEAPAALKKELPFEKADLPVIIVDDHTPYKQRKVRILNGAHTSMVLAAYLSGQNIVRECMDDTVISTFMEKTINEEIIPTLSLPREELADFASAVTERFKNPFIDHALLSIALNSTSKWKARVLPSFLGYIKKTGTLPPCLTVGLAAYIAFYHGNNLTDNGLEAMRGNDIYIINDDRFVLEFFDAHKKDSNATLAKAVLSNSQFWGEDLSKIAELSDTITRYLDQIASIGMYETLKDLL